MFDLLKKAKMNRNTEGPYKANKYKSIREYYFRDKTNERYY